ncbi:hypothetical protein INS49_002552 [Diaporthe citri]|uniref:uncharacterized protein n=1 Tax=Diaporthe citri TaxID=83186 RepID=UPI001C7F26E9|nr:uncharacterized protein INS49_002552 [Diaporthe citri]KAG6368347.1 hypothetical protein INS49_002552 [Diaporthe citri]
MASSRPADMLCDSSGGSNTGEALGEITNRSTAPCHTPGPYVEGMVLDLPVNWTRGTPSEERVLFTVTKVFEVAMSPVMEVQWSSSPGKAPSVKACWQRYVQSGQAPGFFEYIKEMDKQGRQWYIDPLEGEEDTADTWETTAKKEGLLQYRLLQSLKTEIRAYKHLEKLQGKCVPLFYGTTSFSLTPLGSDPQFFRVDGILTQHIDGSTLDSLLEMAEASPDVDYQGLVQRVVEVAEDVNTCGVVNVDCVPHNMIIQIGSMQPFEFDFSQCSFREDFASEDEYNENVRYCGNPVGFAAVVAKRLSRKFKLGIRIKYGPWIGTEIIAPTRVTASWDWNKVVRADYADIDYMRLALEAKERWANDALWKPFYHESGAYWVSTTDFSRRV